MKTIDLVIVERPIEELLDRVDPGGVLLRLPNGKLFFVASVSDLAAAEDDFAQEIAQTRQHAALRAVLAERFADPSRVSAQEARKRLGID
jgi:hypothetical protein